MKWLLVTVLAVPMMAQEPQDIPLTGRPVSALEDFGAVTQVDFRINRSGLKPEVYSVTVDADGSGVYREGEPKGDTPPPNRKITISTATWKRILAARTAVESGDCETKVKNIAQTGKKRISYAFKNTDVVMPQCEFNYSDDATLNDAASAFQAIAETIQIGDRLKWKKRFDHLGLDAELDGLVAEVKRGFAIELQNIAPVLRSIAEDETFLASSRRKAQGLLGMIVEPAKTL